VSIDQFAEDLRFLKLFAADTPVLDAAGMRRLLADVAPDAAPAVRSTPSRRRSASNVLPMKPSRSRKQ
jgi:hypothetical protein